MEGLPKRKDIRLKGYDYGRAGYYFVTICTAGRKELFWNGGRPVAAPTVTLSSIGKIVQSALEQIAPVYKSVRTDRYCIMPNHIHCILVIEDVGAATGRPPDLARVVNQFKGYTAKKSGAVLWQKGYYEHVIRSEAEYLAIWRYVDENPLKWAEDKYYSGCVCPG